MRSHFECVVERNGILDVWILRIFDPRIMELKELFLERQSFIVMFKTTNFQNQGGYLNNYSTF